VSLELDDYKDEKLEILKEEKPKKKKEPSQKKVHATRASGIKRGEILFRGDKKYKFRLVPVDLWNGGETQEFTEKDFSDFKKPVFYKGE
jgi:hypothetical protein